MKDRTYVWQTLCANHLYNLCRSTKRCIKQNLKVGIFRPTLLLNQVFQCRQAKNWVLLYTTHNRSEVHIRALVWCGVQKTWQCARTQCISKHVQHNHATRHRPHREATPLCVGMTQSSARHPLVHKEHLAAVEWTSCKKRIRILALTQAVRVHSSSLFSTTWGVYAQPLPHCVCMFAHVSLVPRSQHWLTSLQQDQQRLLIASQWAISVCRIFPVQPRHGQFLTSPPLLRHNKGGKVYTGEQFSMWDRA